MPISCLKKLRKTVSIDNGRQKLPDDTDKTDTPGSKTGKVPPWDLGIVPKEGIEPSWSCLRRILSPLRLPVSPLRLFMYGENQSGWGISSYSMYLPLALATILPISFSISALFSITRLLFLTYHPRIYRFSPTNAG